MFKLFSLTKRLLFIIFCTIIAFNVNILAANDSNDNQISEVLSDLSSLDLIDGQITEEEPMDNETEVAEVMSAAENSTTDTAVHLNGTHESRVNCTPVNNQSFEVNSSVILVNVSKLSEYLEMRANISQTMGGNCTLVMFYYKWCPFSAKYAKHYNALGRVYPQFHVLAIDAYGLNSLNMRYGLVGVPTILFFHNGKIVGKLNDSNPTIDGFVAYIQPLTGLSPVMPINVTDEDLMGPLSSIPESRFDYLLLLAWIFALICLSYLFAKSNLFKTTIETVRNNWREAEAQHEHMD